jgi:hypothetical protein
MSEKKSTDLSSLAEKWPSSHVARKNISKFSGGMISAGYISNLDSQGQGPSGRIKVGRQIVYEVGLLISWLEARSKAVNG